MADRTVRVRLEALTSAFNTHLATSTRNVKAMRTEIGALSQVSASTANDLQGLGTVLVSVGASVGVLGGLAVRSAMKFDQAMSAVQAATHASASAMEALRSAALEAGADTVFTASEAAQAIENLSKAGVSTADILGGGLRGALDLAAAGQIEVGQAAEIAATAMTQFRLAGQDVTHVADLLAAGAGKAQGGVADLAAALNQSGLVASQMGLSVEETIGTLTTFASAGLLGSDAGTSFRTMLLHLANPSKEAAGLMERLGVAAYDAAGNFVGIEALAGQMQSALSDQTQATRDAALATIFGSDAIRAASLLYTEGAAGVAEWTAAANDQGYAAETAALKMDNLAGDLERLGGAIDSALIDGGSKATDALRFLAQTAEDTVEDFSALPGVVQTGALALGGLVGTTSLVGGGFLFMLPRIQETKRALDELAKTAPTTARMLSGISKFAIGAGVVASVFALAQAFEQIGGTIESQMSDAIRDLSKATNDELVKAFEDTGASLELFETILDENVGLAMRLRDEWQKAGHDVSDFDAALAENQRGLQQQASDAERAAAAISGVGSEIETVVDEIGDYSDALDSLFGRAFAVDDAVATLTADLADFADQVHAAKIEGDALAASLDETTARGAENAATLRDLTRGALDVAVAMREQGASEQDVANAMAVYRGQLIDTFVQLGFNRSAVEQYVDVLLQVPGGVHTKATLDVSPAMAALNAYIARLQQIPNMIQSIASKAEEHDAIRFRNLAGLSSPVRPITGGGVPAAVSGSGPRATAARDAAAASAAGGAGDAAAAAEKRAREAEEAMQRAWEVTDNAYAMGLMQLDDYLAELDRRQAMYAMLTPEWQTIQDQKVQVLEDHARVLDKVYSEAIAAEDRMFEAGKITNARYREILVARFEDARRLHGYWSEEAQSIYDDIVGLDDRIADRLRTSQDIQFREGRLAVDEYKAILMGRHAAMVEAHGYWSEEAESIRDTLRGIDEDIAENARQAARDAADALEELQKVQKGRLDRLNALLDDERAIRQRVEQSNEQHRQRMAAIARSHLADQQAILDERRDQLLGWADIAERTTVGWGNTASALTTNIRSQIDQFAEWADKLAAARESGVSEAVIQLLGLDEGPQALGQLRMFSSATQAEIAALNAAVEARAEQASTQVAAEARRSYSQVGQMLYDLAEKHAAEVEKLTEEFLADQRALSDELAALGLDQGRSWGDAVAQGLLSSIPAIRAAAQAVLDAMKGGGTGAPGEGIRSQNPLTKPILGPKLPPRWGFAMHAGGIVGGAPGSEVRVTAMAGERVFSVPDNRALIAAVQSAGSPQFDVQVIVGGKPIRDEVKVVIRDMNTGTAIAGAH